MGKGCRRNRHGSPEPPSPRIGLLARCPVRGGMTGLRNANPRHVRTAPELAELSESVEDFSTLHGVLLVSDQVRCMHSLETLRDGTATPSH